MSVIDRKFQIQAVNPVNGKRYDETNSLLLCAKDAAVPAALNAYYSECVRIGANHEHQESVLFLLDRVIDFQKTAGGGRTPDTIGAEIPRCLNGEGLDDPKPQGQWAIVEMFGHQRVADQRGYFWRLQLCPGRCATGGRNAGLYQDARPRSHLLHQFRFRRNRARLGSV